jgi:serine/threonine-protein kinase
VALLIPDSAVSGTAPKPGDLIAGKYLVNRALPAGGMSLVFSATHVELGIPVAIKFLLADSSSSPDVVTRFLREARATVELRGEHVVRVYDVGRLETGEPYMVMEYLLGRDLREELVRCGPLPCGLAVDYVLQACEALAEAHARGIVHRDIKPSNLFLGQRPDGSALVKVLDFGISKIEAHAADLSLTATQSLLGSPQYMSPEQVRSSRQVDARTDIWSLGVVLYELVTGRVPFTAPTLPALSAMIVADPVPALRTRCPYCPDELEAVILKCLEKERALRYADVGELAAALREFSGPVGRISADRASRISRSSLHDLDARSSQRDVRLTPTTPAQGLPTLPPSWPAPAPPSSGAVELSGAVEQRTEDNRELFSHARDTALEESGPFEPTLAEGTAPRSTGEQEGGASTRRSSRAYVLGGVGAALLLLALVMVMSLREAELPAQVTEGHVSPGAAAQPQAAAPNEPEQAQIAANPDPALQPQPLLDEPPRRPRPKLLAPASLTSPAEPASSAKPVVVEEEPRARELQRLPGPLDDRK